LLPSGGGKLAVVKRYEPRKKAGDSRVRIADDNSQSLPALAYAMLPWSEWIAENPVLLRDRLRASAAATPRRERARWAGLGLLLLAYAAGAVVLSLPGWTPWDARALLLALCGVYLLLVTAIVPAVSGSAISSEREAGTLEELWLTGVRPSQIFAGKWVLLCRAWAVVLAGMAPLLWMAYVAASLPWGEVVPLLVILVAAPLPLAATGLWLSSFARTRTAVLGTYTVAALLLWITLVPVQSLAIRSENPWWYANPLWQVSVLCLGTPGLSPLAKPLLPEWCWYLLAYAALTAFPLWRARRRLTGSEG
jgi:hypothetical protein